MRKRYFGEVLNVWKFVFGQKIYGEIRTNTPLNKVISEILIFLILKNGERNERKAVEKT